MNTPPTSVRDLLQQALAGLPPDPPAPVSTPAQLDAAVAQAPAGSTIVLSAAFLATAPYVLPKGVTLQSDTWAARAGIRMTLDEPAPRFLAGIQALQDGHRLLGLDIRSPSYGTLGIMGGALAVWDRVRLLGDPVKGAHRGIEFRGSLGTIARCFVDGIFAPAQDTQALGVFDAGPGLLVQDCWLSAAGQAVMLGGADPSSAARIPRWVQILDSDLTKDQAWLGAQQVKCALELKNAIGVRVRNCRLRYAGTSQGQGAYLIVVTPRNQGGAAPFSCVRDVEIAGCSGSDGAGILNLLGSDNVNPSGPLDGLALRDSAFTGIDGTKGSGRLFLFDRAPANVALAGLTVQGTGLQALGYFTGAPPSGLSIAGMSLPPSKYGWKVDGSTGKGGSGLRALQAYMPDLVADASVV